MDEVIEGPASSRVQDTGCTVRGGRLREEEEAADGIRRGEEEGENGGERVVGVFRVDDDRLLAVSWGEHVF